MMRKKQAARESRAGMEPTYSVWRPGVKAKEAENWPKMKDLADFRQSLLLT
jgi:hypothetical protein